MNLVSWQSGHFYIALVGVLVSLASASGMIEPEDQVEDAAASEEGLGRVRRASFNAWAGKRSSEETITLDEEALQRLVQEIAQHYESIAHPDSGEKRASFNSWAGKRASFNSWAGKRAPFNSWAGKRAFSLSRLHSLEKELPGHKVRRKRSSGEVEEEVKRERRSPNGGGGSTFSTWGGKRSGSPSRVVNKADIKALRRLARSTTFSAWGGK